MKKVWIFFPEMTLAQFPKSDFLNFRWIFFPKMTLAQFPVFGFFFQDSRIGVKYALISYFCLMLRISNVGDTLKDQFSHLYRRKILY